ncbi:hypothetical protein J4207_05225 [Candidatus Woesearchaeota archaeon]|nr:hypothetical protein [Candidatus Woesearchaeota archaeon]
MGLQVVNGMHLNIRALVAVVVIANSQQLLNVKTMSQDKITSPHASLSAVHGRVVY